MLIFEDKIDEINAYIAKRRQKWKIAAISGLSFDDVAQIIRTHIYTKWHLWDQSRPFGNWVNTVISHRIRNLIRDHYGNLAPPCNSDPKPCAHNQGGNLCSWTPSGVKCSECPFYAKWELTKKVGYNMMLAGSTDAEEYVEATNTGFVDYELGVITFNELITKSLNEEEAFVYQQLYVEHMDEKSVKKNLRMKHKNARSIVYIKASIIEKSKKILKENNVFGENGSNGTA